MNGINFIAPVGHTFRLLCCLGAVLAVAGCTTTLSGGKAKGETAGLVYYLPAPHLYLSPQADGSVVLEVKYLPDPTNAYTLQLDSYLSKATFEVGTSNGLLSTVNLNADTSEVAASAVAAATEIRKAHITAAQTKDAARKTQEDAKRTAVKAAADAVTDQRDKVALLQDKQKFYEKNPPKEGSGVDLLELKLELSQEKLKLTQLEARLGLVKGASTSAFNEPGAVVASAEGVAYGPMLFRMLQDGDGVKLVAVEDQITLGTPKSVAASSSVKATPAKIVIRPRDVLRDAVIDFSEAVVITAGSAKVVNPALGAAAPPVVPNGQLSSSLSQDAKKLTIRLPSTLVPGRYRIDVDVTGPSGNRQQVSVPLEWLLPG